MRPTKLTMTAFGPYKETEIVDFGELKDNRLFVISGATGSGKTTIFDGICFALYGQASGEDRTDIRAMRSDFSGSETQTAVELTFEINNRTYRIMRQIPYTKLGNKTETSARCEFYEMTETGEIPVVDRQIVSEINKKAEELIGFTQAQFSQIVMLPQGEFRKFLTSDTENKETIMRKIFKTEPYREIVEQLKLKKDEAQAILASEKQLSDGFIKKITSILPEREGAAISSVLGQEYHDHNIHQIVESLEEELLFYSVKTIDDKKNYDLAYKSHEQTLANFHTGKMLNERFAELNERQASFMELSARVPLMDIEEKRLADAERAVAIEQIELQFKELEKEVTKKAVHLENTTKNVQSAVENLAQIELQYKDEEDKKELREQLAAQLIRLNDSLPAVGELESKREELLLMKKELNELKIKLTEAAEKTVIETEIIAVVNDEIDQLEEQQETFAECVELLNVTNEKYRIVDEFIVIEKQLILLKREKDDYLLEYEKHKKTYDQSAQDWLMNEAATLAESLHDGDSCPVCGSTAHPEKARHGNKITLTKEELEAANEQLSKIESHYRTAAANYQSNVNQLENKEKEVLNLGIDVENIEYESTRLYEMKKMCEQEVITLREKRKKLTDLKEQAKRQRTVTDEFIQKKLAIEKHIFERNALYKTKEAVLEQMMHSIPEDLRIFKVLEQRIIELQTQKIVLERAWEVVQKLREEGKVWVTTVESAEIHAKSGLIEAEEKKNNAEITFVEALEKSAFSTALIYHESKMTEDARRLLKVDIMHFKQQLHTVQEAIAQLSIILEGKVKVELDVLEIELAELKGTYERALTDYNRSVEYEKIVVELKESIVQSTKRVSQFEEEYGEVTDLFDVVRGQNGLKLSFERYIQIEYLERIIQSANERLREMSNGQFELIRSDRQEIRGRQSGLGLDVYDAYTGQTRDVKTLSGGEKFNASLCLALGMADVIQSFQGAVSIDTMFIDEGFGSLDEESLNKAIDTLIDLQKSGRMIGVISHVEELKAAFPAILEVKKSKEGHSHTRFSIK